MKEKDINQNTNYKKLKKELSEKTKEIEDKKRAQKDDVKTKEETKKEN